MHALSLVLLLPARSVFLVHYFTRYYDCARTIAIIVCRIAVVIRRDRRSAVVTRTTPTLVFACWSSTLLAVGLPYSHRNLIYRVVLTTTIFV